MNVKSAVRVIEVLEFFDTVQREASLSEIARELGYPLSSTSVLLQSLVERGYLSQGDRRSYRPTPRVKLLGAWLSPLLDANGPVTSIMDWVGAQCQQLVVLAAPEHMQVRYIRVVQATGTVRMHVMPGSVRPLPTSGLGRLFMSRMSDEEVDQVVRTHNAGLAPGMTPLHAGAIRRELLAIRAVGCSVSFDKVSPGAGVVAVMVPTPVHETPLAIGIGAPSALIRANAANYGALLREALGRFCTPTVLGGGVFVPRNGRIKGVGA
jgi:IclR family acetate operon transcriptional repressor